MSRLIWIVLVVLAAVPGAGTLVVVTTAGPAAADCSGPMIGPITTEVARGVPVTITGEAFGSDCYDTGPPPPGQGALGEPIDDLEIVVAQGATEVVVATGAADADYRFSVVVTVPTGLAPGEAAVWARHAGASAVAAPRSIVVSAAPVGAGAPLPAIARFGPDAPASRDPSTTEAPTRAASPSGSAPTPAATAAPVVSSSSPMPSEVAGPSALAVAGTIVVVTLAIVLVAVAVRRRSPTGS